LASFGLNDIKDLAGHAISRAKRFRFVWASFSQDFRFAQNENQAPERADRGQKAWRFKIRPCGPRNPLITLKTANEMFGKAWRFQAIDFEKLGVDLEKRASVS
jgi:hypothetical protein